VQSRRTAAAAAAAAHASNAACNRGGTKCRAGARQPHCVTARPCHTRPRLSSHVCCCYWV
jgi:hypothetical protein